MLQITRSILLPYLTEEKELNFKVLTAYNCNNWDPGGHIDIKMSSYQYRDPNVKYKMVSPTVLSLTWESPYLGKTVFILRRGPEVCGFPIFCLPHLGAHRGVRHMAGKMGLAYKRHPGVEVPGLITNGERTPL